MAEVRTLKDGTLCKINEDGSVEKIRGKICTNKDCNCVNEFNAKFCSKCGSSFVQTLDNIIISDKSKYRSITKEDLIIDISNFRKIRNSDIDVPDFYFSLFKTFVIWIIITSLITYISSFFEENMSFDSTIFAVIFWSLVGTIIFEYDFKGNMPCIYRRNIKKQIDKIEFTPLFKLKGEYEIYRTILHNQGMALFIKYPWGSKIIELKEDYDIMNNIAWLNKNNLLFMYNKNGIDIYDVESRKLSNSCKSFHETNFKTTWLKAKIDKQQGLLDVETMEFVLKPDNYSVIEDSILGSDLIVLVKDKKLGLFCKNKQKIIIPPKYNSIQWESSSILEAHSDKKIDYFDLIGNKINK